MRKATYQPHIMRLLSHPALRSATTAALFAALFTCLAGTSFAAAASGVSTHVSVFTRVSYDSNVYLENDAPNPAVIGALPEKKTSAILAGGFGVSLDAGSTPALKFSAQEQSEYSRYTSASEENYFQHRLSLTLKGVDGATEWLANYSVILIDGSADAPIYGGYNGAPSMGAIPVRDRRDALIQRAAFKLLHNYGRTFVRAVGTGYWHDFRTHQIQRTGAVNFIDRDETTVGLDFGYNVEPKTRLFAGWRIGRQHQGKLLGVDSHFDSTIRRFLVGCEGLSFGRLQLNLLGGLDTRTFASGTPAKFDRHHEYIWVDSTATYAFSANDTFNASAKRYAQPAFASVSFYDDFTYEVTWRHKYSPHLASTVGYKIYGGTWRAPVARDDKIDTFSLGFAYTPTPAYRLEATWLFDHAFSELPATSARDYDRHILSLSANYTF